jgi:hypothetical protein
MFCRNSLFILKLRKIWSFDFALESIYPRNRPLDNYMSLDNKKYYESDQFIINNDAFFKNSDDIEYFFNKKDINMSLYTNSNGYKEFREICEEILLKTSVLDILESKLNKITNLKVIKLMKDIYQNNNKVAEKIIDIISNKGNLVQSTNDIISSYEMDHSRNSFRDNFFFFLNRIDIEEKESILINILMNYFMKEFQAIDSSLQKITNKYELIFNLSSNNESKTISEKLEEIISTISDMIKKLTNKGEDAFDYFENSLLSKQSLLNIMRILKLIIPNTPQFQETHKNMIKNLNRYYFELKKLNITFIKREDALKIEAKISNFYLFLCNINRDEDEEELGSMINVFKEYAISMLYYSILSNYPDSKYIKH